MTTLRTFIVVKQAYERHLEGEITVQLVKAIDLNALAMHVMGWDVGGDEIEEPFAQMQAEEDGGDYYIVKELLADGTLSKDLMSEHEHTFTITHEEVAKRLAELKLNPKYASYVRDVVVANRTHAEQLETLADDEYLTEVVVQAMEIAKMGD